MIKCQYGFYTCQFIGNKDFCNSCDGGQNYQMKEKKRKPGSGGTRPGSGRKSLFKEKTKGVKFMCPISKESDLKKYVNRKLLEWSKSGI